VRKAWLKSDPDFDKIVTECTRAIVDEVEALKNLVDEFAQFARLPVATLRPGSLHDVLAQALSLYEPSLRPALKAAGFLTRDSRVVERKKFGKMKARRSYQFSKR